MAVSIGDCLRWLVGVVVVGLACAQGGYAQPDSLGTADWGAPPAALWADAQAVAAAPRAWATSERSRLVGTVGVLAALAATLDEPAYRHLSPRSGAGDGAWHGITDPLAIPGEWYDRQAANRLALTTVGVMATSGLVLRRPGLTRTAVRTAEAILYAELANGLLKSVVNRARPYVGAEPDAFAASPGAFDPAHERLAMPSGHAARVFAVAAVWAHAADRWYVSGPLYAGAASVGLERVRSGDHWLTDVVVGGALGYFIGRVVADAPSPAPGTVQWVPLLEAGRVGMQVQF